MEKYQKMWRYMESNHEAAAAATKGRATTFVSSYEEGVRRVLDGDFAFLCESTMLDYLLQRNCNLTQVGDLLDNKVRISRGNETSQVSTWSGETFVYNLT